MSKRWIFQHPGYGLGNFIMSTPALRLFYKKNQRKINIFFGTPSIAEVYRDCRFINILKIKPRNKPGFTIRMVKRKKNESDCEALCRILVKNKKGMPHTYIDPCEEIIFDKKEKKCIALFHGCLGKYFRDKKDIGIETRQYIIDKLYKENIRIILLGTDSDRRTYWKYNNLDNVEDCIGKYPLRESVGILRHCDGFISNDTGLYHVAGALRKNGLVLWKKTNLIKNKSPFNDIQHVVDGKARFSTYKKAIDGFIEKVKK